MSLDLKSKEVKEILDLLSSGEIPSLNYNTLQVIRELTSTKIADNIIAPIGKIETGMIPGPECNIPVKIYYPKEIKESYPGLVFLHGGGFVLGLNDSYDYVCSTLTNYANCVTISVDYRLAPENRFPAAVIDSYAATQYIYEHSEKFKIDPLRIAIAGDSAGGNLAAVVSNMAKDKGTPKLCGQILIYPTTAAGIESKYPSIKENAKRYSLTEDSVNGLFALLYATDVSDMKNPHFSPIFYPNFEELPSALIITAEYCPLRDEGEEYATKLNEAGVKVKYTCYKDMLHGFVNKYSNGFCNESKAALKEIGNWLLEHYK